MLREISDPHKGVHVMKRFAIRVKLSTLGVFFLFLSSLLCIVFQGDPWKIVYSSSNAEDIQLAEAPIGFSTDGKHLLVSSCSEHFETGTYARKSSSSKFGFRIIDPCFKEIFRAYGFHSSVQKCDINERLGLAVASEGGSTFRVYDLKSNALRREVSIDDGEIIFLKCIGDEIIFASSKGAFFLLKTVDGPILAIPPLFDGENYAYAYLSPNANMILLCSSENDSALIFEPHSGKKKKLAGTQGRIEGQVISPFSRDGESITLCNKSKKSIVIYDTSTGTQKSEFSIADGHVSSDAQWSSFACDSLLVFGSTPKTGKIWRIDKSECFLSGDSIFTMSPNGKKVIFWNGEIGGLQMHDTFTGARLHSFPGCSALFSPHGSYLVIVADGGGWGNWSYNIWLQHHSEFLFSRVEFWLTIVFFLILVTIGANNLRKRVKSRLKLIS